MQHSLAERVRNLKQSEIRAMTSRVVDLGGVNLAQGLCDLPTPQPIKDAACRAIQADHNTYAVLNGLRPLREKIAGKLSRYNGITADPETQVTVASGATGAWMCALLALLDPGDRVLVFEPFYGYHVNTIELCGLRPVFCRLSPPSWDLDPDILEKELAGGVRALALNTPSNPSGKVFTRGELEIISSLCRRHDVWVITDEIYEHIVFGDRAHTSIASLEGMFSRTVTISGFSKTFAMTGWRLGYAAGPEEVIGKMSLVSDLVYICAPHPLQAGLAEAFGVFGESYYQELPRMYGRKRDILDEGLNAYGFELLPIGGTYFQLADYTTRYGRISSLEAARRLLEETGIASVPASSFYAEGFDQPWLRFCFAMEDEKLVQAAGLLKSQA